jgi:nucleoside 2-deoxyribosyltransferase
MTTRIFLSHSAGDRDLVREVRSRIAALDIEVYMFEHDPQPGTLVAAKIQQELDRSDAVVVIITPRSSASSYVHQEIGFALGTKKPVIPLVEKGTSEDGLAMLKGVEYVELDPCHPSAALEAITTATTRLQRQKQSQRDTQHGREQVLVALALVAAVILLIMVARDT